MTPLAKTKKKQHQGATQEPRECHAVATPAQPIRLEHGGKTPTIERGTETHKRRLECRWPDMYRSCSGPPKQFSPRDTARRHRLPSTAKQATLGRAPSTPP
ncbi:unnamed protein product [Ectocarpus sp. 6 AP-2014]